MLDLEINMLATVKEHADSLTWYHGMEELFWYFVVPYVVLSGILWNTLERHSRGGLFFFTPYILANLGLSVVTGGAAWTWNARRSAYVSPIESLSQIVISTLQFLVLADVYFYVTHYSCHRSAWLWRHIHRHHHLWKRPFGIQGIECHPIEMLVINIGSVLVPILIVQPSPFLIRVFISLSAINAVLVHSTEFQLRWRAWWWHTPVLHRFAIGVGKHLRHHEEMHRYFGTLGIMDRICG